MRSQSAAVAVAVLFGVAAHAQPPEGSGGAKNAFPVPTSVRVIRGLEYATYGTRTLKLDLYLPPAGGRRPVPGVIAIRGNGWRSGDKEAFGFIAGRLASEGFAAASIEYRTAEEAKFPAAVQDTKAAIRWLRAHAAEYGIAPNAIGAIGGSAGGHLAALLATSDAAPELEGAGGNAGVSSRVEAAVAMACVCDPKGEKETERAFLGEPVTADRIKALSPLSHVSPRAAPLLLLHSRTDPVVPFEQSLAMEAAYRKIGVAVKLVPVDAPQVHAFWNEPKNFPDMMRESVAFLREHLHVQ